MRWPKRPQRAILTTTEIADVRDRLADMMIVLQAFDERLQHYTQTRHDDRPREVQEKKERPGE